jgi:hypothetical protein
MNKINKELKLRALEEIKRIKDLKYIVKYPSDDWVELLMSKLDNIELELKHEYDKLNEV